jgi:hypothetical protein
LVLAGYATAFLLTCAFFYVRELLMPRDASQASAGMQAFADLMLFLGMFGVLSLVPTGLALYFLRSHVRFWTLFSILCLAFACTGPVAAVLVQPSWGVMEFFKIPRILGAPLFCLAFLISALLAPARLLPSLVGTAGSGVRSGGLPSFQSSRPLFLAAAAIEAAVSLYTFLCLFVLQHWLL